MASKSALNKAVLTLACIGMVGVATPAFAKKKPQELNYRDRFQGVDKFTRIYTNTSSYPLILDVINIQSSTGEPILLQVSDTRIAFDAQAGPLGNYSFFMAGQWPPLAPTNLNPESPAPRTYFCTANTSIVIQPGDSFRGYSLNGASFSISISGHYAVESKYRDRE